MQNSDLFKLVALLKLGEESNIDISQCKFGLKVKKKKKGCVV